MPATHAAERMFKKQYRRWTLKNDAKSGRCDVGTMILQWDFRAMQGEARSSHLACAQRLGCRSTMARDRGRMARWPARFAALRLLPSSAAGPWTESQPPLHAITHLADVEKLFAGLSIGRSGIGWRKRQSAAPGSW
ncbi:hypothetical protein L1887_57097 [Cichorium endivia]|nr:hypothetical protein L1887_57097 [Cichorium endivia]